MRSTSANSGGRWRLASSRSLQGLQGVLVGHRGQAEARAAVADVAAVVDLVVAVEALALRPRALVRRVLGDRPPAGAPERLAEGEAVALDELVVAAAGCRSGSPTAGWSAPASSSPPKVDEVRKALREEKPGALQLRGAAVEHGVDPGREGRALHRDLPVALDEQEQDVLAAQAGQQPVAGRGVEAVLRDLAGEDPLRRRPDCTACTSWTASAAALVEATGAPTIAQRTQTTPSTAAARSAQSRWPAATRVTRSSARTGRASSPTRSTTMAATARFALRSADRVAQRLDADAHVARVVDGVERPVEGREEPHVEDLHDHEQRRAPRPRRRPARGAGRRAAARPARGRRAARGAAARTRRA